jgi:hypothetical protein
MKAIKSLLALSIVAAFSTLATVSITAADKPTPAEKKADKAEAKDKFRPFRGTIKSIDKAAKTIVLEGEKAQTFTVAADARINKNGKPAAFADLATGDTVGGRAKEAADGKWMAMTVNVRPAGKPADKPSDKK